MVESSCDHTMPDLVTRCCLHWSISCTMNSVYMTLKSSNVKRRFGYVLNCFFHRETEQFWRFFRFYVLFALCVTRSLSILKTLYCPLMINLFCKESRSWSWNLESRSQSQSRTLQSRSQSRVVETRLHLWHAPKQKQPCYHRLCGSSSTAVTMTSKVNGKMEICASEAGDVSSRTPSSPQ